ncbi:TPA: hypothetical protein HA361_04415 [Candidatus Woesearchaeota archaeon]|nr:hypothetical protein [Candidatus Woesearchaeota archaeon]HII68321.1 hypothetical protein [Candidatus Woesearchaeota archaeon]
MSLFERMSIARVFEEFRQLKANISEWVVALDTRQYEAEKRIAYLEQKLRELLQNGAYK